MSTFKPTDKNEFKTDIKTKFLVGDILRCDSRDEKPIEAMRRDNIKNLPTMRNIGMEMASVYDEIHCSHKILFEVIEELSKQYSVREVRCMGSGCGQYSACGYYLDGE